MAKSKDTGSIAGLLFAGLGVGLGLFLLNQKDEPPVSKPPVPGMQPVALPNGQSGWYNTAGTVLNATGQLLGIIDQLTGVFKPKDQLTPEQANAAIGTIDTSYYYID